MKDATRQKLGKMLGMLGSEHDGEVVAAARMIGKILAAENLSFGDLVAMLGGETRGAVDLRPHNSIAEQCRAILDNGLLLKPHELKFVRSIMAQATLMPHFRMSEKQLRWFAFIYERYGT